MKISARMRAIAQAFFVTFLWSTSWILIKFTLADIPPITFAGLRYALASLILLPGVVRSKDAIRSIQKKEISRMLLLGIVYYSITQGAQFLTLKYLYSTTFSLMLNFSSIIVALIGYLTTKENPSTAQWAGIIVFLIGALLYFWNNLVAPENAIGLIFGVITVAANSAAIIMGRSINRKKSNPPLVVTFISMACGALILVILGLLTEGVPTLSWKNIVVITWLSAVNTAFAFTLWNKTQQALTAIESTIINNSMLIQISILAWVFLDETYDIISIAGLLIAVAGLIISNVQPKKSRE